MTLASQVARGKKQKRKKKKKKKKRRAEIMKQKIKKSNKPKS